MDLTPISEVERIAVALAIRRLYHSSATEIVVNIMSINSLFVAPLAYLTATTKADVKVAAEARNAIKAIQRILTTIPELFHGDEGLNELHSNIKVATVLTNLPTRLELKSWRRRF
jgi:hypothetical protein